MKRIFTVLAATVLLTACINGGGGDDNGIKNHVVAGDPVPSFTVTASDGAEKVNFTQADFIGKRSVIVFFNIQCPDCKREMPKVHAAWQEFADDPDFQTVAISRGEKTAEEVTSYWVSETETKPSFDPMPFFLDFDKSAFETFANLYVPRLYLVGTDGKIAYMAIETFDFDAAGLIDKINGLQ